MQPKTQAREKQLNSHESFSIYACRVREMVNKGWPEIDAKM